MITKDQVATVAVTALVAVVGFLGVTVIDIKSTLSAIDNRTENTDQRVTRIAETLPEVKARIAWEEVNGAASGVVISERPRERDGDNWESVINLYDSVSGTVKRYKMVLDGRHKNVLAFAVAGKVKASGNYDPSFSDLVYYSMLQGDDVVIPGGLNPEMSFILRDSDVDDYAKYLNGLTNDKPEIINVGRLKNWREISASLDEITQ